MWSYGESLLLKVIVNPIDSKSSALGTNLKPYIYIYIYIVSFSIRTLSHAFSQHSLWPTQNGRFNNHLKYSQFIKS